MSQLVLDCYCIRSQKPSSLRRLSLAILILLWVTNEALGHGLMCTPRQRGAYRSPKCVSNLPIPKDPVNDYCAHCLNGGTVSAVKAHLPKAGWSLYEPTQNFDGTAKRAGLCGDAAGHSYHMIGGDFMPTRYKNVPIVQHWKTGGHVDFMAEIDTNHNGYFEFFLCNLDACKSSDISGDCFRKGHCYILRRVPHPDCQDPTRNTHYECGPIDTRYPSRWYLPCRNTGSNGLHLVGGPSGTMRYKLPDGVSCRHCVVQWYWATANSCAPRGLLDYMKRNKNPFGTVCSSDGDARGTFRAGMATCGGKVVPEEYWSCADVQITVSGKSAGPVKAVSSTPGRKQPNGPRLNQNLKELYEKAKQGLRKGFNKFWKEGIQKKKENERKARHGKCLLLNVRCDGSVQCCHTQQVCVYSSKEGAFTCKFWWSLYEEAEVRERLAEKQVLIASH